jgi:hypothetical protein
VGCVLAVHQEIKVLQHDGANQSSLALGLDDGRKRAITAHELNIDSFGLLALSPPAIGVLNSDLVAQSQAELFD